MPPVFRADHVGSFLRTPEVLKAHEDYAAKKISLEQLREVEDKGILALIELQKQIGQHLRVSTKRIVHRFAGS